MELQELENHFSPADGWQCDYCMDIIPCDIKGMNAHLADCQEYKDRQDIIAQFEQDSCNESLWECKHCGNWITWSDDELRDHLNSCKVYQEQHHKENSSNCSKCPECNEKTLENFDRVCTYCGYEEIVS